MKEAIRNHFFNLGFDDVGFATVEAYHSPKSPDIRTLLPGIKTIIVLAIKELSTCESASMQIAMGGRLDVLGFVRSATFQAARYLERTCGAKAMTVPFSYPVEMSMKTLGSVGEVSLRHAAVAAGLGTFGRHNLVIHPKLGSRVLFSAIITDLELPGDEPVTESLCTECEICVKTCPGDALKETGKTDVSKCLKNSQPYGIGANIRFWTKFAESTTEEQQKMVKDPEFWRLYQAGFIGFQYFCFNCYKSCPIGESSRR